MKRFVVDNNSDPGEAREAIKALKRTIAFGKRAELALRALREHGHFDGKVPVFTTTGNHYSADVHRFPAYEPISRDDIPDWDRIGIVCGAKHSGTHGGAKFSVVPVYVLGTGIALAKNADGTSTGRVVSTSLKLGSSRARLGDARMKANGEVTFEATGRLSFLTKGVFRVKRNPDASDRTREEAMTFAKMMAHCLVDWGDRHQWQVRKQASQKMLDLQDAIPTWLVEDGIVKRAFGDILDAVKIIGVMDS